MAKIKLDLDPKPEGFTFPWEVTIPTIEDKVLKVTFDFVFRDRVAFADLLTMRMDQSRAQMEAIRKEAAATADGTVEPRTGAEMALDAIKKDIAQLREIAKGWNVDFDWNDDTLMTAFLRKYAAAPGAIWDAYKTALTEGRLGN